MHIRDGRRLVITVLAEPLNGKTIRLQLFANHTRPIPLQKAVYVVNMTAALTLWRKMSARIEHKHTAVSIQISNPHDLSVCDTDSRVDVICKRGIRHCLAKHATK